MSKRILMIADSGNFWTKNYIVNLLLANDWEVVVFPIWDENDEMNRFYEQNGVTVYHDTHKLPVIRHIPRLRMWVRIYCNAKALQKIGSYDVVHNHILSQRDLTLGYLIHRWNPQSSWVASFWGSDLLRATKQKLRRMRFFLKRCDHITTNSLDSKKVLLEKFPVSIAAKTQTTYFGQHIYNTIDALLARNSPSDCKQHFGLNPESPVIALGYNASPTHQHAELLRIIAQLPPAVTQTWSIVLQVTYGNNDPAYIDSLRKAANALPCQTLLLTEAMDETECSYLRIAADVYVHALPTDAMSASLREYLYTGTQVLCGDWLSYPEFNLLGIEMKLFSDIDQVGSLLLEAVSHPIDAAQMENRKALKNMFSWEAVTKEWNKLYGL